MTPVLKDLHWLPVKQRIEYKVALVTHKVLETNQPGYLADLVSEYKPGVKGLRSATQRRLTIPTGLKSTAGQRTFISASEAVWNRLPQDVRLAKSLLSFKSRLKTHFFQTAFYGVPVLRREPKRRIALARFSIIFFGQFRHHF
jgi:hypothetical protein